MYRREYLAVTGGGGIAVLSGCLEGSITDRDSEDAENHLETAEDHLETAAEEFDRASGRLWDLRDSLEYSTETVDIAIEEAREELDEAEAANPSSDQQAHIDRLRSVLTSLEHIAGGYGKLLEMYDSLELMDSYIGAGRRDAAFSELANADEHRETAVDELEQAAAALDELDSTELEADFAVVELEQRVGQTRTVLETIAYLLDGWEHELTARFAFGDGDAALSSGGYETAIEEYQEAHQEFDEARSIYRDGEDVAETELRQTLIEWVCEMEHFTEAAEHALFAAQEYEQGYHQVGDNELSKAREAQNSTCGQ